MHLNTAFVFYKYQSTITLKWTGGMDNIDYLITKALVNGWNILGSKSGIYQTHIFFCGPTL